ncbi:hypothetical protein G6F68_018358 [Rhizopus microsporus]|nr:hypothetical protein G6F68_018358 [Rhizopus microsporus]
MSIKIAMGCGIGLYLCFIGLQSSAGIGLVTLDKSTLVTLGACPADALDENGVCTWGHMTSEFVVLSFCLFSLLPSPHGLVSIKLPISPTLKVVT